MLKRTKTGKARLRGELPKNVIATHKTVSFESSKEGIPEAVNDVEIIFLSNGRHYFIGIFVSKSTEHDETNEKLIADVSKVT